MKSQDRTVFVTGAAGYVGSMLVPILLEKGYKVKAMDLNMRGLFKDFEKNKNLQQIEGDLRDQKLLKKHLKGCTDVIHLGCISNDASFDKNPELGKAVNYDAFMPLVDIAKESGVTRFIYASSSSVYGVREEPSVTEDLELQPMTDYAKYKALCEDELFKRRGENFATLVIRPAAVCGYAPGVQLNSTTVNILTKHAILNKKITVFGGQQRRPNINVKDMCEVYAQALAQPVEKVDGKIYNAGYANYTVMEIAQMVRNVIGDEVQIVTTTTTDNRSYHISGEKIKNDWGFEFKYTIEDAVRDLKGAHESGRLKVA